MKNDQVIRIKSNTKGARVIIYRGSNRPSTRQFPDIYKAVEFVLPLGDRRTRFYLNGYDTVLNGWVEGAPARPVVSQKLNH